MVVGNIEQERLNRLEIISEQLGHRLDDMNSRLDETNQAIVGLRGEMHQAINGLRGEMDSRFTEMSNPVYGSRRPVR